DQTNQVGYIESLSPNVAWRNLVLQSGGGNVGIGTTSPAYVLDVGNRMRVRQSGINTAGMWFYQTGPAVDRAFVGMLDDRQGGFYGNTGAGWGMVMGKRDGTVGIGTTDPIAKLHAVAGGGLIGVFGQGVNNSGVHGFSSGSSGVSGTTAGTSFNAAGVY